MTLMGPGGEWGRFYILLPDLDHKNEAVVENTQAGPAKFSRGADGDKKRHMEWVLRSPYVVQHPGKR